MHQTIDPLSLKLAALADPTRRAILQRLGKGTANVAELAKPFDISQPAISKHLKVLETAGLIERGRTAQSRPCRLAPKGLDAVEQWLETYRAMWEQNLDRLEAYLATLTKEKQS
jgi:DNA-binding transcriptional ArsR family regulator